MAVGKGVVREVGAGDECELNPWRPDETVPIWRELGSGVARATAACCLYA